jgi:hypothetical protein
MCNAKPGRRCAGPDTQKPIAANAKKLDELKKAWDDEKNPDKRATLRDLVMEQNDKFKESKVTYYASAKAQKDFPTALQKVKELSGENRGTYDDVEKTLFIAGGHLHELQAKADNMRKRGASQIEVARYFNQGGIMIETDKMRDKIAAERNNDLPNEDETFDDYTRKLKALEIARGVMWRDCSEVVGADMKKNSAVYSSDATGSKLTISKRPTGRFAITSEFNVSANSPEEAGSKAANAFDADKVVGDVNISVEPVAGDTGKYHAKANYIYKGGENLTDALIYQNQIYKGHNSDF